MKFSIKQFIGWFVTLLGLVNKNMQKKEYCNVCGQELTEIRGRYPKDKKRKVCACCAIEKLERLEDETSIDKYGIQEFVNG